jgi:hypothetical protein
MANTEQSTVEAAEVDLAIAGTARAGGAST